MIVKYWDEYQSKWGFSDGDATPPDAYECREVYVAAVNAIAERLGSKYVYEPFDRGGLHNCYMVVCRRKDETVDQAIARHGGEEYDEAMSEAINIAFELGLDQYVTTTTTVQMDEMLKHLSDTGTADLKAML